MRWVSLGAAEPREEALLARVRALLEADEAPGPEWTVARARLERQVWRVPGEECALYVKRQLYRTGRVRLRYCLRRSPLAREARMAVALAGLGLEVPRPLLLGEEGRGWHRGRSLLVTRELPGEPAAAALAAGRLELFDLAALLGELARLGVFHPDLHLRNLLLGTGGLALLDLQSVRRARGTLRGQRLLAMAAKLGVALQAGGHATAARWAAALGAAGLLAGPAERERLARAEARIRSAELASRLRRCLRDSTGFAREPWGGGRLFRKRSASREEILSAARAAFCKDGRFQGLAGGRSCLVGPGRALRRLWVAFRRQELQDEAPGPAEALVEKGRFRRRSCLVFRQGLGAAELAAVVAEARRERQASPGGDRGPECPARE